MSEDQAEYVTEALELLHGEPAAIIEQPQSRLVLRDGLGEEWTVAWVKLSTAFKPHIKTLRGSPLAVWLYLSLSINKNGVAFPGIKTIAEDTGYSVQGVIDATKILEEKGYIKVRRGERKYNLYEPEFAAIGRVNEPSKSVNFVESSELSQVLPPDESTFSPDDSSGLDLNKRNKKEPDNASRFDDLDTLLSFEKAKQGHEGQSWQGREIFRPDHLPLVDWYHASTGQDCPKSKQKDWLRAVMNWSANGLTVDNLQAAYDMDIKWRKVFTSPNQLTDKAIALKAQKQTEPQEYYKLL